MKDDFKGLYAKLNGLEKAETDKEQVVKTDTETKTAAEAEAKQKAELTTRVAEAAKIATEMIPYKNLAAGRVINDQVLAKIKNFTIDDFINGTYIQKSEALWVKNENRDKIMSVLDTYARLLSSNEKVKVYITGLKATMSGAITFETLSYRRHEILAVAGYTGEFMKQQEVKVTEATKAQDEAKRQGEKAEFSQKRDAVISEAILNATTFPVPLPTWVENDIKRGKELGVEYPVGKIDFDASKEEFNIGEKRFSLKVKPFKKAFFNITDAKITKIQVKGDSFELS